MIYLKINIILFISIFIARQSTAQERWLQPDKFIYKTGEDLKAGFKVGENFVGSVWDLNTAPVDKVEIHHLNNITNLKPSIKNDPKENIVFPLQESGTEIIVTQTAPMFKASTADMFNMYLKNDGLDDALYQREKTNTLTQPGKENYTCYSKLIIHVGETPDETFKKVIGLPLEIVPDKNPYTLKTGSTIHFKILFEGKPLFGAKVRIWNTNNHLTTTQNIFTQQDGTIEMPVSNGGSWLIHVVKMVPSKSSAAAWQTYKSSLVFGIR